MFAESQETIEPLAKRISSAEALISLLFIVLAGHHSKNARM